MTSEGVNPGIPVWIMRGTKGEASPIPKRVVGGAMQSK